MNPPQHPAATTSPKARRSDSRFLFWYIQHENRWECLKEILHVWERQNIVEVGDFEFEIQEVLRCILRTVLFHRDVGLVRPKDADLELFDITYVQCGDLEIEKKIEEKIEQFISWVEKHPNKKSQIYDFDRDCKDVGVALFTTKYFVV
uniref:Autophagy-related protein 101 n=1 Tax=Cannabis sativa TaxID=3483 RepID=A0A803QTG9_CANSA